MSQPQSKVVTIRLPQNVLKIIDGSGISRKEYIVEAVLFRHSLDILLNSLEERIERKIEQKFAELFNAVKGSEIKIKKPDEDEKDTAGYVLNSIDDFLEI